MSRKSLLMARGMGYQGVMGKPWYADGLCFTCTACGECCKSHGGYEHVYLTLTDIGRLADHMGLKPEAFLEQYTEKESSFRVLKWPNEQCIFLTTDGCGVYEGRPEQCRTWPFWEETLVKRVWEEEVVPFCPGAGEGRLYKLAEIRELMKGKGETTA